MNCPAHVQVFKQGITSYRDLPLRLAEFGTCHRNEAHGALHGIMRVRQFSRTTPTSSARTTSWSTKRSPSARCSTGSIATSASPIPGEAGDAAGAACWLEESWDRAESDLETR
jgi:hypothetical protein